MQKNPSSNITNSPPQARSCPICASNESNKLCLLKYCFPDSYNMEQEHTIVSCKMCGFVFNTTQNNYADLERHAKENNRYEGFYRFNNKNYALTYVSNNFDKNVSIIDVGCSVGSLLLSLREKGYKNLYALDPSEVCINYIKQQGIDGIAGSVYEEHKHLEGRFDVITCTGVLEHITDPFCSIESLKRWLKPDGTIILEVPHGENYHLGTYNFTEFICAEHVNHFSINSLDFLMYKHNFKNILTHISDTKNTFHCVYIQNTDKDYKVLNDYNESVINSVTESYRLFEKSIDVSKDKLSRYAGKDVSVWGMSHLFMSLYAYGVFSDVNISLIVDIDKSKQGLSVDKIMVKSPDSLNDFSGIIVLPSNSSLQKILHNISEMKLKNEVVIL